MPEIVFSLAEQNLLDRIERDASQKAEELFGPFAAELGVNGMEFVRRFVPAHARRSVEARWMMSALADSLVQRGADPLKALEFEENTEHLWPAVHSAEGWDEWQTLIAQFDTPEELRLAQRRRCIELADAGLSLDEENDVLKREGLYDLPGNQFLWSCLDDIEGWAGGLNPPASVGV